MNDHWNTLLSILLDHLPAAVDQRREALDAIVAVLPKQHPARPGIVNSFTALNTHIGLQREIVFSTRGSARLGDQPMERGAR